MLPIQNDLTYGSTFLVKRNEYNKQDPGGIEPPSSQTDEIFERSIPKWAYGSTLN